MQTRKSSCETARGVKPLMYPVHGVSCPGGRRVPLSLYCPQGEGGEGGNMSLFSSGDGITPILTSEMDTPVPLPLDRTWNRNLDMTSDRTRGYPPQPLSLPPGKGPATSEQRYPVDRHTLPTRRTRYEGGNG